LPVRKDRRSPRKKVAVGGEEMKNAIFGRKKSTWKVSGVHPQGEGKRGGSIHLRKKFLGLERRRDPHARPVKPEQANGGRGPPGGKEKKQAILRRRKWGREDANT